MKVSPSNSPSNPSPPATGIASVPAAADEALEDDSLDELPPLDGGDGEDPDDAAEDLEDEPEGGLNLLDDATGEGEPLDEIAVEGVEGGWLDDAADAEELDIGAHDLDLEERTDLLTDVEEPGVGDEDFNLDPEASQSSIDGGEEGPDAEDDELRVEDLPQLDADDDSELEDAAIVDPWSYAAETVEEARPAWDDRAWERTAWLTRAALETAGFSPGAVTALALQDGALLVATDETHKNAVYATPDEGKSFALASFYCLRGTLILPASAADGDASPGDFAVATTTDGNGAMVTLVRDVGAEDGAITITRAGAALPIAPLDGGIVTDVPVLLLARGAAFAFCPGGAGVHRVIAGPAISECLAVWSRIDGTASATAMAFVDDAGTLLVALHSETEERAWLVRVDAAGVAGIVAELGGDDGEDLDVRVTAIAWDDAKRTAWVAGAFGIAAFRRA